MTKTVGYKLIDGSGKSVKEWGGIWGQCPGVPNVLILPNGDHVHAPSLNVNYSGYTLVEWKMEEPPPSVPTSITPRQCRLILAQQGLLDSVEAMIAQQDRATQITWEYALEFRRDDPLLNQLAVNLGLSKAQIDQFFIEAAKL